MQEIISIFADIFASKGIADNIAFKASDIMFISKGYAILGNRTISDSFSKAYYPQDYVIKNSFFVKKPISLFFYDLENGNYIIMECKGIDTKLHLLAGVNNDTWNGVCEFLILNDDINNVCTLLKNRNIFNVESEININMFRSRLLCSLEYLMQTVNKLNVAEDKPFSPIMPHLKDLEKNISIVCSYEGGTYSLDMYDKKYPQPTQMVGFYF